MDKNLIEQVVEIVAGTERGNKAETARVLKISRAHMNTMLKKGRAPVEQCKKIEVATGGQITAAMLRPDIFETPDI